MYNIRSRITNMICLRIEVSDKMFNQLNKLANEKEADRDEIINNALEEYIEKHIDLGVIK